MYQPATYTASFSSALRGVSIAVLATCLLTTTTFASTTPPVDPPGDPLPLAPMDETDELGDNTGSLAPMDETDELGGNTGCLAPMDETDELGDNTGCLAPMDETDELGGNTGSLAPMDETDEFGSEPRRWIESSGYGLLEIVPTANGEQVNQHPWCPWSEAVLSPVGCARQLRFNSSRHVVLRPASATGTEVISLKVVSAGLLLFETQEGAEALSALSGAVSDAAGQSLGALQPGESMWLEPGTVYLQIADWTTSASIELDIMID